MPRMTLIKGTMTYPYVYLAAALLLAAAASADASHFVECGRAGRCPPGEVGHLASDDAVHEIRCCSDADPTQPPHNFSGRWDVSAPRQATTSGFVCPYTESPQWGLATEGVTNCPRGTYGQAADVCAEVPGARLCTVYEALNDCLRGTGCGFDNDLVWTATAEADVVGGTVPPFDPDVDGGWTTVFVNDFDDGTWQDFAPGGQLATLNANRLRTFGLSPGSVRLVDNSGMDSSALLSLAAAAGGALATSPYAVHRVRFWWHVRSFENVEDFYVEYCPDDPAACEAGDASWVQLGRWEHCCTEAETSSACSQQTACDFDNEDMGFHVVALPTGAGGGGGGGGDPHLRFRSDASGVGDYLYIDHVEIQGKGTTGDPSASPVASPSASPGNPTASPTDKPTTSPSVSPTKSPTKPPTASPTNTPTASPTDKPTTSPSDSPSHVPTVARSDVPTGNPTTSPTGNPTVSPTEGPTASPTDSPTQVPTLAPNTEPVWVTIGFNGFEKVDELGKCDMNGWFDPGRDAKLITNNWGNANSGNCALRLQDSSSTSMVTSETYDVTTYDSLKVVVWFKPRNMGSSEEFYLSISTDNGNTYALEHTWTNAVTGSNSNVSNFTNDEYQEGIVENIDVTDASDVSIRFVSNGDNKQSRVFLDDVVIEARPASSPTKGPTPSPSASSSSAPTVARSATPSSAPTTAPTGSPTVSPTKGPSASPSASPSIAPTATTSASPTGNPTASPTKGPTASPTDSPTPSPTKTPTGSPTTSPTATLSTSPSGSPTASPEASASANPSQGPSKSPTTSPAASPSAGPSENPSAGPTASPEASASANPSQGPTDSPTTSPEASPSASPSLPDTDCDSDPCQNDGVCVEETGAGVYTCNCTGTGYGGTKCTDDVDECSAKIHNCHTSAICTNTDGSFTCTCQEGYAMVGQECVDVNECDEGTHTCASLDACINTDSGHTCECPSKQGPNGQDLMGYDGDGTSTAFNGTGCEDIDECEGKNVCNLNAVCINSDGSYSCECKSGFSGDGVKCENDNDCLDNLCENGATCNDGINNYTCSCADGYAGTWCEIDINECASKPCENGGNCTDGINEFTCDCTGTGYGGFTCQEDINECSADPNPCHANAFCNNTVGSYNCTCNPGYTGDGVACVENTDAPSSSPSSSPTQHPTDAPSTSPSTSNPPTSSIVAMDCGAIGTDSPTDVGLTQEGTLEVTMSSTGSLCTLTEVQTDASTGEDVQIVPIARSYEGQNWESAAGGRASSIFSSGGALACSGATCTMHLPAASANSRYVLTSYDHSIGQRNEVARFLDQSTFGVTTNELNYHDGGDWTSNAALYRAKYVKNQMDTSVTPMTSHREYWRSRTNPKVTHSSQVGRTDHPCDPNSRWRKYAFNRHDRRNMISGVYRTIYFYTPESEKNLPDPDIYEAEDLLLIPAGVPVLNDIGNNLVDTHGPGYYGNCEGDCDRDTDCAGALVCFLRDNFELIPGCYGWGPTSGGTWQGRGTDFCYDPNATVVEIPVSPGYYIDDTPESGHTGWNYLEHWRDGDWGQDKALIEFTVSVPLNGTYPLSIRYAQSVSWLQDVDLEVTINNTAGLQVQTFNTGYSYGSNDWRYTPYYYYNLTEGDNKVRIRNTNYYGAKIDHLRVGKAKATIINVDGHNRTTVHDRIYYTEGFETNSKGDGIIYSDFNNKTAYEFCDFPLVPMETLVEGRARVRKIGETYCGNEAIISVLNPMIDWSDHEDQVPGVMFTDLPNLSDAAWTTSVNDEQDVYKSVTGYDFQLVSGITDAKCMDVPFSAEEGNAPVFAKLQDGTYLQWTSQLVLEENTIENPIFDGGGEVEQYTDNGRCSNVPRSFLNEEHCVLSTDLDACPMGEAAPDIPILLDEINIIKFFELTGKYVYAILGLVLEEHQAICSESVEASDITRWMKNATNCTDPTAFDQATEDAIAAMLSSASDTDNPLLVDVRKPSDLTCTNYAWPGDFPAPIVPIQIQVGDTCYTQVHPHLYNVYDATGWVGPHPGGAEKITKWANTTLYAGWHLIFPRNHPGGELLGGDVKEHAMSRWDTHGVAPKWNSLKQGSFVRFLDSVSFRDLYNGVKANNVSQHFGDVSFLNTAGATVVCGSPGEIANDPVNGALYDSENPNEDTTYDDYMNQQKTKVWTMIALEKDDQLRQRMAWSLSQIVTVVEQNIDAYDLSEIYLSYYDIMVRHAFGNYRDILKEAAYSPLMAEHLTYLASKSHGYVYEDDDGRMTSPDENFAREIMQLFTIGLIALDEDGTQQRDENGTLIETYTNEDIMSFSRAWTGFQRHDPRGNYEDDNTSGSRNRLDPMYIDGRWRDRFAKSDLTGGYIGDTYPLCVDVPDKMFLRPGGKYRLLGADPLPEGMVDHPDLRYGDIYDIKRMVLDPAGDLFAALNDGSGNFRPIVELTSHLNCTAGTAECVVDTVRVVQVQSNDPDDPNVSDVFYEYVPPPCVHQAFYEGAKQIARRYRDWEGVMCADPRLAAASEACCDQDIERSVEDALRAYEYHGERMTYASAERRCLAKHRANLAEIELHGSFDGDLSDTPIGNCQGDCDIDSHCAGDLVCFQRQGNEAVPGCLDGTGANSGWDYCVDPIHDNGLCLFSKVTGNDNELGYHWTNADCKIQVKINNEGYVAVVHDTFTMQDWMTPAHVNAEESLNWFRAYWDGNSYPSPATGCGNCRETVHSLSGTAACVCDASVVEEPVFSTEPASVEDIVSSLYIGAIDPAIADSGSYHTVVGSDFRVHFKGAGSTTYNGETIFELNHPYHGTKLFLKNVKSTVQLSGWTQSTQIFEAEDAEPGAGTNLPPLYMYAANTSRTDYTGSGYMDWEGSYFAYLNFTVNVQSEKTAKISFKYENSWGPTRSFSLSLNDTVVNDNMLLQPTGHWDFWAMTPSYTVTLQPGDNIIQIKDLSGVWSGPNIDHMVVEGISTSVDANAYSFRNAPHFMGLTQDYSADGEGETNPRDAHYETDAVLDHYFQHRNTAPFICTRLIQRHGISNPSPRYIKECAIAFRTGSYESAGVVFGSNKYGCLEATAAAVSLDPEATSPVLDRDPAFGSIREPWLRPIQLLRTLDYDYAPREKIVELWELSEDIGEEPSRFPSVFSFFLPEYRPDAGPAIAAGLVSPESMLVNMPTTINMQNGLWSLIRYGVSDCYDDYDTDALGFGRYPGHGNCLDNGSYERGSVYLSFVETANSTSAGLVDELSTLLTQGRLSEENRDIIIAALDDYTPNPNSGDVVAAKRRFAMQLIVSAPEYHTLATVKKSGKPRAEAASTGSSNSTDYKATILLFFDGGADSWNMLPPHTCDHQIWEKYEAIRGGPANNSSYPGSIALAKDSLWELPTNNPDHNCQSVGLHQNLHTIKDLYHAGDAIFITNTGLMSQNVSKADYRNQNVQLFAHNAMQLESMRLDLLQEAVGTGVLGRMRESLTANGYSADAYSITGNQISLIGKPGSPAPIVLSSGGMKKFDPRADDVLGWWGPTESNPDRAGDMTPRNMADFVRTLNNASSIDSNMMAETWSIKVSEAIAQHELLYDALASTTTATTFPATGLGEQFRMVTQMMQTRQERGVERDFFHVSIGGWDTHSWVLDNVANNFNAVDDAIAAFVTEVKSLGLWNHTIVAQFSEFARTLDPNTGPRGDGTGAGSDHAWGGHQFILGGGLKGGKVFGQYPDEFKEDLGELALSRGRMLPTTPWDSFWNGAAPWMGVPESDLDTTLPMRVNFDSSVLFTKDQLFNP